MRREYVRTEFKIDEEFLPRFLFFLNCGVGPFGVIFEIVLTKLAVLQRGIHLSFDTQSFESVGEVIVPFRISCHRRSWYEILG